MGADVDGYGAAFGFGLFFFARGVGTGLGPIVARAYFTNEEMWPSLVELFDRPFRMFVFLGWIKRLLRFVDDGCSRHPRSQRQWGQLGVINRHGPAVGRGRGQRACLFCRYAHSLRCVNINQHRWVFDGIHRFWHSTRHHAVFKRDDSLGIVFSVWKPDHPSLKAQAS